MSILNQFRIKYLRSSLIRFLSSKQDQTVNESYGVPSMPDRLYKTVELEIQSSEPAVLKSYEHFVSSTAKNLGLTIGDMWSQKKPSRQRWTVLKSVHIYRKHLVQYEIRSHFTWLKLHKLTGSTADTFIEYIERMLPEGVALKVTKISVEPKPAHLTKEAVANQQQQ